MTSILFGELDKCDLDCALEAFFQRYVGTYVPTAKRCPGTLCAFETLMVELCKAKNGEDFDFWTYSGPLVVSAIREGRTKRGG